MPARIEADAEPFDLLATGIDDPGVEVTVGRLDGEPGGWSVRVDVVLEASDDLLVEAGRVLERIGLLATAYRLEHREVTAPSRSRTGWRMLAESHWIVA